MESNYQPPSTTDKQAALTCLFKSMNREDFQDRDAKELLNAVQKRSEGLKEGTKLNKQDSRPLSTREMRKILTARLEIPVAEAVADGLARYREVVEYWTELPTLNKIREAYRNRRDTLGKAIYHLEKGSQYLEVGGDPVGTAIAVAVGYPEQCSRAINELLPHLDKEISEQRAEARSRPEVLAERRLVCGLLTIADGSIPTATLVEELLPEFKRELRKQAAREMVRLQEFTLPGPSDEPNSPVWKEIPLKPAIDEPTDLEEAYLRAVLRRRKHLPPNDTLGFLDFGQVALLLIILNIRRPLARNPLGDPNAGDVDPERIFDAADRIANGVVRERWREIWGEGRTTRRKKTAKKMGKPEPKKTRSRAVPAGKDAGLAVPQAKTAREQQSVRKTPVPEVGTDPDMMGTPPPYLCPKDRRR